MFDAIPAFQNSGHLATSAATLCGGPVTTYLPGSEIYAAGDKAGALYQLAFGVVRIYRILADGRRQICAFQMPGEVFGFDIGTQRGFFADAVTSVGLRVLRPGSEQDLTRELLTLALRSLSRAHDHLLTLGRTDAVGRVAGFLLEIAERQEVHGHGAIDLPMSRTDIADYLGLTIETVSRALTKLKTDGVIRLASSRVVEIPDWTALEYLTI